MNRAVTMRAHLVDRPDGAFADVSLPMPAPGPGQVLIRVRASGVNPLDVKIRAGQAPHARQPLPAVLGLDVAGIIEDVGPDVTAFSAGDEVYGMVGGVGGFPGTLADAVLANTDLIAHKPVTLTMREAAALPLVMITAWEGLIDRAGVHAGDTVLVHAGAGGVGHIAVQLARAYGANVFATVSAEKREVVERFGATAIDYATVATEEYVRTFTGDEGFDVVFDTVGGATLDASFHAVKTYTGRVVSALGWGAHSLAPLSFRGATYSGVFTLLPLLSGRHQAHHGNILRAAAGLVDSGKLTPLLSRTRFSRTEIDAAYRSVASGSRGKVVVEF